MQWLKSVEGAESVRTTTGPVAVPADGEAWAATRDRGDGHSWSQSAEPGWPKMTLRA